jgi:L-malate glycosyltransferase
MSGVRSQALATPNRAQVALVSWCGAVGGAETQNHLIAREFRNRGIDASIVFIQGGGPLTKRLERDRIPWHSLNLSRGSAVLIHPFKLLTVLEQFGPDGLILPDINVLISTLRTYGYRSPIVGVDHGSLLHLPHQSLVKRWRLRATRAIGSINRFEHVVVSEAMRDTVLRHRARSRCTLIYNGVDLPQKYSMPELTAQDSLVIGAVGRLTVGKGLEYAIQALANQPATLRIAGDGPDRTRLEALAIEAGVRSKVEFLGWIDDVQRFWRDCHVGALPSVHPESFGLAAAEAMAAGRPVIVSQHAGLEEIVGSSGIIVPPGDPAAIAETIGQLATSPHVLQQLAGSARRRAEQLFDIRKTTEAYARLLGITQRWGLDERTDGNSCSAHFGHHHQLSRSPQEGI